MRKILYIIPGWEETTDHKPYGLLASAARQKGYEVILKDVDWTQPLSQQVFSVPEEATICGFSLGAILAWMVAQKYPCRKLILASMTPHYSFERSDIKEALADLTGAAFVQDIIKNLEGTHQAQSQTILYGDKEDETADILIPDTEHELTNNYIQEIINLL